MNPPSRRFRLQVVLWTTLVVLPSGLGLFAALWIEVCRALFVAGGFLLPVGLLAAWPFAVYCWPVAKMFPHLCFHPPVLAKLLGLPFPCEWRAWIVVAAFYTLLSVLTAAILASLQRRRGPHSNNRSDTE